MAIGHKQREGDAQIRLSGDEIVIGSAWGRPAISLRSPRILFDGGAVCEGLRPAGIEGDPASPEGSVKVTYEDVVLETGERLSVELYVRRYPLERVWRKWACLTVDGGSAAGGESARVLEIVLEQFDAGKVKRFDTVGPAAVETGGGLARQRPSLGESDGDAAPPDSNPASGGGELDPMARPSEHAPKQSQPVFFAGCFAGIEFPAASTRLEDGALLLAHRPGVRLTPGTRYETLKAVYGFAGQGGEKEAFRRYLRANGPRRGASELHVNYNSWWTSPVPYSEDDILNLMATFKEQLFDRHGAAPDTFCIDLGWSNPRSEWQIDSERFPAGFRRLERAAAAINSRLGVWISPSSCYPQALDNDWAEEQGIETSVIPWAYDTKLRIACLGGERYRESFRSAVVRLAKIYDIKHFKLDGCILECEEAHHGHAPGIHSPEAVAAGFIAAFREVREAVPDIWLETTCFGWNPSPWWLFHVDSVIGTFGDDAPHGRVPSPVYWESYTTARDYFNLQGTALGSIPAAAQEVLGIIVQTDEPFLNDAVMTALRGHLFLPLYVNPANMNDRRWRQLAEVLAWARANAAALDPAEALLPASWANGHTPAFTNEGTMPREPYGYAHWTDGQGLIVLRNPWIRSASYRLTLPGPAAAEMQAVGIYPEVRSYGRNLQGGEALDIPLAPYETIVLSVAPQKPEAWPDAPAVVAQPYVEAELATRELSADRVRLAARVSVMSPQAELLVLLESPELVAVPACTIVNNGEACAVTLSDSAGWAKSTVPKREDHWLFLRAPLAAGDNDVRIELSGQLGGITLSTWVWTTKPGADTAAAGMLPAPDTISLGSCAIVEPATI